MSYNLGHVVGPAGKGISSITKTGTSGLVDTYTILFSDGTSTTFDVTNGSSGADIVTSWEDTLSDSKVPSEKLTKDTIDGKASTTHSHGNISSEGKIGSTSGKPVITGTGGAVTTGAFGTSSGQFAEGNHTHTGYQETLVSGTNIKTINSTSILGSGNITIQGGGGDVGSFGDLQDLIDDASSGDIIILDKDYKNTGSESEISIDKPLTIIGNGHIIDADKVSGIFNIDMSIGAKGTILDLIFINGSAGIGGAINSDNDLTISGCIFNNNSATTTVGGAINGRKVIMSNCSFNYNSAETTAGAVYCTLSSSIKNCSFNYNSATNEGGAVRCSASASISDCSFNHNTATDGGNVYNSGTDSLIIYNCHITTGMYNASNYDDLNSNVKVTSWSSTVSNDNIPSEKLVKDTIDDLQDQIDGVEEDMLS